MHGSIKHLQYIIIYIYYIPPPLTVHFSMTRSMRYQPIYTPYITRYTLSMRIVLVT